MSDKETDTLARLHTDAVDAKNGYTEAIKDSDGHSLFSLFESMVLFHSQAASELEDELMRLGATPEYKGSFMSVVHQSILKLRSLVGGLDRSVLPGLIDGETRNLSRYDDAIRSGNLSPGATALVERQRGRLADVISRMRAEKVELEDSPVRGE